MAQLYLVVLLTFSLTSTLLCQVSATDPSDVLFTLLADPCEESWNGRLGDQLFNLVPLMQLNVSSNHIYDEIPPSLPPNATYMNLSFDYFGGNIPYSFSPMKYLCHLNLSRDLLSGPVGNVLSSLQNLKRMDLSSNNFTGDLPISFQDLKNRTALNLPNSSYSKEQQQASQPNQEQQQQPPQSEQEQQPQPQPDHEQQQHNGDEVANVGEDGGGNGEEAGEDDGGGDGEENEGEEEEDEEEEEEVEENEEEENEEEEDEDENVDQETKEADNFCRPDDPKTYGDDRLVERIKRTIKHFHRKN